MRVAAVAAAALAAATIGTAVAFARFTRDSIAQERGIQRLSSTLDRMGIAYADVRGELDAFAASQQEATRFGDDETRASINRIAQLTGALQPSIQELTRFGGLAADLAEAREQDLTRTSTVIGRAVAGDVEALTRFMPAFRDTLREIAKLPDAAERGAAALEILESEFGGAARAIDPLDLALARVRNGMGDVREALGGLVRTSPQIQTAFGAIADVVNEVADAFDPASENAEGFKTIIVETASAAGTAILSMTRAAIGAFRVVRGVANEFRQGDDPRETLRGATEGLTAFQTTFARRDLRRGLRRAEEAGVVSEARSEELLTALGGNDQQRRRVLRDIAALQDDVAQAFEDASFAAGAALESFNAGDAALRDLEGIFESAISNIEAGIGTGGGGGGATEPLEPEPEPLRPPRPPAGEGDLAAARRAATLGGFGLAAGIAETAAAFPEEAAAAAKADSILMLAKAHEANTDAMIEEREETERLASVGADAMEEFSTRGVRALTSVAQQGFANLGAMMAGVDSEKFGKVVLKSIGAMASGLGSVFLAAGAALMIPGIPPFFNPAQGAGLIAAGGALSILGGALGAAASKKRGGGGGDDASGFDDTGARDSAQRAAADRRTPRFSVLQIGTVITEDAQTVRKLKEDTDRQIDLGGLATASLF